MSVSPTDIVDYLRSRADRPLKAKELARGLDVASEDYAAFTDQLKELEDEGVLYRVKRQRYAVPDRINLVVGRLQTIRSGAGFVIPDQGGEDLFIPSSQLGSAVDGDRVVARVERRKRKQRAEGRVIRVLERARSTVVGVYHPARNYGFVVPEDTKLSQDVFIPPDHEKDADEGDVVVVEITSWGDAHHGPAGTVDRVLGRLGDPGVDVLAVLYGHELPLEFPPEVEREAEQVAARGMTASDREGRRDLTDLLIFTIDPPDAKDHDDALSIRRSLDGERWQVGIHIADVSHYVTDGSELDQEAMRRGTSVYLVDRVVPMLPEALSADLCSLRPDEDRLAMSLLLELDDDARVHGHELVRSVIRSRHKLSYDRAQAVLDGDESVDRETDEALANLLALSRKIRARREERGSIDFDLPEARVVLNTQGEPTDIQRVLRLDAHRLIEDFMILANRVVAGEAERRRMPFIHRNHEEPDAERIEELREFVATFGYRLRRGRIRPKDLQQLLEAADGKPEEDLLSTVVLRSMKQARYGATSVGHFGLASDHYTHFTSPIRRYADLVVHRLCVRAMVEGEQLPRSLRSDQLASIARLVSDRERLAESAERDSVDLKKVEFMQRHLGDEFDGTISGVTSFGLFVLLDRYFVEGLVHVSALEDDYYAFLEGQYALVGEHSRNRFRLGDRVRVQVANVNLEERKIDFILAPHGQDVQN